MMEMMIKMIMIHNILIDKEKTKRFTRLTGNEFNVSAVNDIDDINVCNGNGDGDDTFIDGVYQHLLLNNTNNPLISKLVEIINQRNMIQIQLMLI